MHRIGRTARAEADGTAYTLINVKEQRKFAEIEKLIGKEVLKCAIPEELGEQPEYNVSSFTRTKNGKSRGNFANKRTAQK